MMKKNKLLKTLLLLTVMLVGSATNLWANQTDLISGVTLPDIPSTSLDMGSQTTFTPDENGWIVLQPNSDIRNKNYTWFTAMAWNTSNQTISDVSSFTAPFYTISSTACTTVQQTDRTKAIRFTGAEAISFLVTSGGSRTAYVSLYSYNGVNQTLVETKSCGNTWTEFLFSDLNTSTDYIAYMYCSTNSNAVIAEIALKALLNTAAVTGYSLDGVKIDGTLATANTDYTLDNTNHVVTLTNSFTTAPTVALVEKTTYDSGDPTTKDVAVTLNKNTDGTYFEGTATIGKNDDAVEWTVKAPVNTTPTLEVTASAITVSSPKIAKGKATFTVTGANLTGESVTLAFASTIEGLTVSPETIEITDGAVEAEVTVSYLSAVDVAESYVNLTISTTGVDAIVIPVTYSSTAGITEIVSISEATTWDWSNTGISSNVESPNPDDLVVFSNIDGWASSFNASAITGKGQYLNYNSNKCFQGSILKFNTTVPGKVTVVYSNTGNRDDVAEHYRYLYINGVKADETGSISAGNTKRTVENYSVEAGDVVLTGIQGESTPNMLRIYSVVFTPATATVAVTGVTLDEAAEVEVGKTVTLTATVAPENATNKNVTWESDNTKVAIVDADGVVTGVAEGTANITVTTVNGNKTATCVVTVVAATPSTGGTAQFKFTAKADWNSSNWQTVDPIKATFTNDAQSDYVKFAKGNTLTLEVAGGSYAITNVKLGYADGYAPKDETITTTVGTMNIAGTEWNGVASELVITNSATSSNDARVNMLEVTYVQAIKTTIGSTGWSTFCSDKALDFTGLDVKAYMVTGVNGTKVEKVAVNETVPANTPLLLNGVAAAAYSIPVVESSETSTADNKLVAGTGEVVSAEAGYAKYVMVASEGKAVFKKIVSVSANVPVGKAYLKISEEEGTAPMFSIDGDDDTTGINSVERGALSVEGCYTLDGRRVENPTKGLYIVNGKKVIIK